MRGLPVRQRWDLIPQRQDKTQRQTKTTQKTRQVKERTRETCTTNLNSTETKISSNLFLEGVQLSSDVLSFPLLLSFSLSLFLLFSSCRVLWLSCFSISPSLPPSSWFLSIVDILFFSSLLNFVAAAASLSQETVLFYLILSFSTFSSSSSSHLFTLIRVCFVSDFSFSAQT